MTVFVDTNVLVYARDGSEPEKQPAASDWMDALWEAREGRLSAQVLHEYYVTVTRKLQPGLDPASARTDVRALGAWQPLGLDGALIESAWEAEDRFGFAFWDALIVAAARRLGCDHLLSEDLQDGQDLDGLLVVDPFRHAPGSVLGE
ncbi:MAG TPA: PIN domain-containing protein [Gemmatimonadota bacterium]|nr:PIN domain-containing protein [Gemmatimonadota bacterium]